MRFYFGFGRSMRLRTLFKWLLPVAIGFLAFFGFNVTVFALDNFQGRSISNTKWCEFGETNPQANCIDQSSDVYYNVSTNGYNNSIAPVGIQNSNNGRLVPDSHSITWIYSGVNSSSSPCNNPSNVSFNVIVNPRDINNVLAPNELNPNSYNGPVTPVVASIREAVLGFTRKSYSSNYRYYKYLVNENNYGVIAGARYNNNGTIQARDVTNCSFFAYGNDKQLKFRCSVNMTQPSNSLFINIQYTNDSFVQYPSSYNNLRLRDEIVVEEIYDPCNPNNNTSENQQGVIDSINNQSGIMSDNFNDLIENNNSNAEGIIDSIHEFQNQQDTHSQIIEGSLEDIQDSINENSDKQDETNSKLDEIQDSLDGLNCKKVDSQSSNLTQGALSSYGNIFDSIEFFVTPFLHADNLTIYNSNGYNTVRTCFYKKDKSLISCITYDRRTTINVSFPNNYYYFRSTISVNSDYLYIKYCNNVNENLENIEDGINQTNNGLNEIKDGISCIEEDYHFNYGSNSNLVTHGYLSSTGGFVENNDYEVSDYLRMGTGENKLTLDFTDSDINYCVYTINKTKISCHNYNSQNIEVEKPQGYYYIRLSLKVNKLVRYKRCNVTFGGSGAGHYFGDLDYVEEQPISSLITMPVYLLNKVISSIENVNECQEFRVPFNVFNGSGDDLVFPCIQLSNYIPATLVDTLDAIFCLVIFYRFSKWIIQIFENLSSADDVFDYMYGGKW